MNDKAFQDSLQRAQALVHVLMALGRQDPLAKDIITRLGETTVELEAIRRKN